MISYTKCRRKYMLTAMAVQVNAIKEVSSVQTVSFKTTNSAAAALVAAAKTKIMTCFEQLNTKSGAYCCAI